MPGPSWRERLGILENYIRYRWLGAGMAALPEPLAALACRIVAEGMAAYGGPPLAMRERHLRRLFSTTSKVEPDPEVIRRWAKRSYRSYGRYYLEGARMGVISSRTFLGRMVIPDGFDHLQASMALGRGVVLALPHVGSWEWGGAYLALKGYPMTSVAERLEPPALYDYFVNQREACGLTIVPLGADSSSAVLRALRAGGLVGLLCDRDIAGNGVEVEFFGERTTFPAGPATLALRAGATLLGAVVYSGPGQHHVGRISGPIDTSRSGTLRQDVTRITQEIAWTFERWIKQAPEQWYCYQPNWPSDPSMADLRRQLAAERAARRGRPARGS